MALCFFHVRHGQVITSASKWSVSRGSPRKRDGGLSKSRSLGRSYAPGRTIWSSWTTTIAPPSKSRARIRGRTASLGAHSRAPQYCPGELSRDTRSAAFLECFCSLRLLRQSCRSLEEPFLTREGQSERRARCAGMPED